MINFSVIIPTYNRSNLVTRAIESVLAQSLKATQIIVVDDGSTDDTLNVCKQYSDRIMYVHQSNAGVSAARNHGIRLARENWTAFLDSDDYWTPTHLEKMAAAIQDTAGQANFYFADLGYAESKRKDRTLWENIGFKFTGSALLAQDGTRWLLTPREPCSIQCSVFNTSTLLQSGGFDPIFRVTEDRELFCRIGIGSSICAVNFVGCIQTSDDNQANRLTGMINTKSRKFLDLECILWARFISIFPNLAPYYLTALQYNLAAAHWRLTRLHWQEDRKLKSLAHFFQSARTQPAFLFWLLKHRQSYGWEKKIFPQCQAT